MLYKDYGKTGKKVSVIGFGGMRFGKDEDYAVEVVRKASELGINYFDTAPFYCDDRSEFIMGKAFKNMPNPFYVSTKSSINKEVSGDDVLRRVETSLERMGVDKINFFHMWCILSLDQYRKVMAPGGPYEGALRAKERGLIDHIVISTHCNGKDIATMVNEGYYEGITLGYNIINHGFRQEGIKAAHDMGMGVSIMNPLSGGLIPQNVDFFSFIKESEDDSAIETAIRFIASQDEVSVVLCGMGHMDEVMQNTKVGQNVKKLSSEKIEEIKRRMTTDMDSLCTSCGYCLECPKDIHIPAYMGAYNFSILKGDGGKEEAISLLQKSAESGGIKKRPTKPSECIDCKKCEALCTQGIPIVERLRYVSENYGV